MSNPYRFKRLRTPSNVFIINLTICDFCACCLHPLAVYSAFRGRWSFGQTGMFTFQKLVEYPSNKLEYNAKDLIEIDPAFLPTTGILICRQLR